MKSKKYPILVADKLYSILDDYGRDNNLSISLIVEELLEQFLYDKGYLIIEEEEIAQTPEDIYLERKNKFEVVVAGSEYNKINYGDLSFGNIHKSEDSDLFIEKLLKLSDDELTRISLNNWIYPRRQYKSFLYAYLEDNSITPEEFIKENRIGYYHIYSNGNNFTRLTFNHKTICEFYYTKYSKEIIDNVHQFLIELSDAELNNIIEERKSSRLTSAQFVLEYMQIKNIENMKYVYLTKKGKFRLQKMGLSFGTYSKDMICKVYDFLESKNWDESYSQTKGDYDGNYYDWLYSQLDQ